MGVLNACTSLYLVCALPEAATISSWTGSADSQVGPL